MHGNRMNRGKITQRTSAPSAGMVRYGSKKEMIKREFDGDFFPNEDTIEVLEINRIKRFFFKIGARERCRIILFLW